MRRSAARLSGLPACESKHGGVRTWPYLFNAEIGVTTAGLQRSSARHNWLWNDNKHSRSVVPANLLVFSQIQSLADNTGRLTRSVFRFLICFNFHITCCYCLHRPSSPELNPVQLSPVRPRFCFNSFLSSALNCYGWPS